MGTGSLKKLAGIHLDSVGGGERILKLLKADSVQ